MTSAFMSRMGSLTDDFAARYCQESTLGWVREIWQSDRESDYTAFARTAAYVADELRRIGASEVEIVECPADGKTRM